MQRLSHVGPSSNPALPVGDVGQVSGSGGSFIAGAEFQFDFTQECKMERVKSSIPFVGLHAHSVAGSPFDGLEIKVFYKIVKKYINKSLGDRLKSLLNLIALFKLLVNPIFF